MTSGRRKAALLVAFLLAFVLYASTFVVSYGDLFRAQDPLVRTDAARLTPSRVERVEHFDHNAVYHVLQGVALVLLYRGFLRAPEAP